MFFNFGVLFRLTDLNFFHTWNCNLLLMVLLFVLFSYLFLVLTSFWRKLTLGYPQVEILCCLIPLLILVIMVIPSFFLLWKRVFYYINEALTVKVTGHQWYWTYELGDCLGLEFDSYLKPSDSLVLGDFNFLEVDNRLVLPQSVRIRFILTSRDVIHSWALPSFFLKLDTVPGLLTVFRFKFDQVGVYYGQCREICGANHSFMPVVVEITLFNLFKTWLITLLKALYFI